MAEADSGKYCGWIFPAQPADICKLHQQSKKVKCAMQISAWADPGSGTLVSELMVHDYDLEGLHHGFINRIERQG